MPDDLSQTDYAQLETRLNRFESSVNSRVSRHEEVMRTHEEELQRQGKAMSSLSAAVDLDRERVGTVLRDHTDDIEGIGTTVEHLNDTVNSIILPTQEAYGKEIKEMKPLVQESHDHVILQQGGKALIQQIGVVIAAVSSLAGLVVLLIKVAGAK